LDRLTLVEAFRSLSENGERIAVLPPKQIKRQHHEGSGSAGAPRSLIDPPAEAHC
jgi:hypothetical protein